MVIRMDDHVGWPIASEDNNLFVPPNGITCRDWDPHVVSTDPHGHPAYHSPYDPYGYGRDPKDVHGDVARVQVSNPSLRNGCAWPEPAFEPTASADSVAEAIELNLAW